MLNKRFYAVLAILVSMTIALSTTSVAGDYEDLEEKVQALSKNVYSLTDTVKELAFQIQQTQSMSAIIKELSFQLKEAESGIRDLQGIYDKIDNLYPQILNLEGTLQGLAASSHEKISGLQGRVYDIETTIQGLDARLKSVEENVRALLRLESHVDKHEERIYALEEFRERLSKMPTGSPEDIAQLMNRVESIRMELSANTARNADRIDVVEQSLSTLPIADMQDQISSSRNRIASLEVSKADSNEVDSLRAQLAQLESKMHAEAEAAANARQQNLIIGSLGLAVGAVALASAFGVF
jgi:chromosome segregation ATPase